MNKKYILGIILIIILGASWYVFKIDRQGSELTPPAGNIGTTSPTSATSTENYLKNVSVGQNQGIESPLKMTGEARLWYFEGSFPVQVLDANNNVLGSGIAVAQGDWMTENFVRFKAIVTFATSTTENGKIVLKKDNPSGLPENDMQVEISIKFLNFK